MQITEYLVLNLQSRDMGYTEECRKTIIGVLALQGAFNEHTQLLRQAGAILTSEEKGRVWEFLEVRTASELEKCDALIIPGGESTAISLVAQRSGLLEPLRNFVK
jgi:pyridoxal 5'-phosphate synthase pdxT subunit